MNRSRVAAALALAVATLLAAGCSAGGDKAAGGAAAGGGSEAAAPAAGAPSSGGATAKASAPAVQLVDLGNRIVRKATLSLEVGKARLNDTISRATTIVSGRQGIYVSSSTEVPDNGPAHGQVTFRVPVDAFEATLRDLKGLGRYRGEHSSSDDVTTQYIDLGGQLAAWRAQEKVYLRLIGQAKSIGDVISIQNQLQSVQSNINRLQGQVDFLRDQSSFSTIELDLAEPGAAGPAVPRTRFAKAWSTAVDGLGAMAAAALVVVIWLAPFGQPSRSAWSSPPSCRASTATPRAPTAVSSMPAASRTRCWLGSLSRRIHGPPRRPSAQAITPARKTYASSTTDRSFHWVRRNPGARCHGRSAPNFATMRVEGEERELMVGRPSAVYIVTIAVPAAAFRAHLDTIDGARLITELPPGRVVVALRSSMDRPRLAALPGVTAVVPDRLEHPDRPV